MPEYPDLTVYLERLGALARGSVLETLSLASPFFLRTVEPKATELCGRRVLGFSRLGKRLVFELEDEHFAVIHLMIAGRLRWRPRGHKAPGRITLATFGFDRGDLHVTEAGKKRRASLHLVRGREALAAFDRGGLEVMFASFEAFARALRRENHTLKRALTDPTILAAIGNAYSDEILHRAHLSPLALTDKLDDEALGRLFDATRATLSTWTERLRHEAGDAFPEKVTAFHDAMAVHGRYGLPCPDCGAKVQRIRYAENETNYCAVCQTGGRLLADRALSRLLHHDWPRSLDALEEHLEELRRGDK